MHPFELPDQNRAISLEILPPLTPPPVPTVEVQLKPRQAEPAPPSPQPPRVAVRPDAQALPKAVEVRPQQTTPRELLDQARPQPSEVDKPVEVERRAVKAQRLQTQQATPLIPEAPPEPVPVTRPAPAARPPIEVPRTEAVGRSRPLDTSRAAPQVPQLPQAAAPEAAAPQAAAPQATAPPSTAPEAAAPQSQVQVLTNESVVQSPVEIRPRERAPAASRTTALPGAEDIPAPAGAPPGGGLAGGQAGGQAGGGPGAAGMPRVEDFNGINGINGGFGAKGLRSTLGCENPDRYKLTAEERTACLQRFGQRAKGAPDLGLAVSARNQAQYDSYEACQTSFRRKEGAIPNYDQTVGDQSVSGVAPLPKACVPLQNR